MGSWYSYKREIETLSEMEERQMQTVRLALPPRPISLEYFKAYNALGYLFDVFLYYE
jgi:hypothetical protein